MEPTSGIVPKLFVGTFAVAILAFVVRGFGQIAVGQETAQLVAAPLFLGGLILAILSFVVSVLFVVGVVGAETSP